MKKLIAMSAIAVFAASGFAAEEESDSQNWRIMAGGYARGGMKADFGNLSDRGSLYGAEIDVHYRVIETESFNLWAGVGGAFTPNQKFGSASFYEVDASSQFVTTELGGSSDLDVGYGELRLLLVPEYSATDNWSFGGRLGVAFDWMRASAGVSAFGNITTSIPGMPSYSTPVSGSDSERFSEFTAQGIMGLQSVYLLADSVGVFAAVEYRAGDTVDFKKNNVKWGSLDLDGWYVSVGLAVQF